MVLRDRYLAGVSSSNVRIRLFGDVSIVSEIQKIDVSNGM